MNKHLYRIIFNKARNMLMVVADIATAGQGSTVRRRSRRQSSQCLCRLTALRLSLLLATGCISLTAQADIVADRHAPGHQQPAILSSANGTPQINIQTPNAAGVSHNTYSKFDIDKQGAILNNSHTATQTQLGGMVAGNPWLAKAEAKIIINEINSLDKSRLNGWIEVAGQKAQVIIANPAGITCDGCGFINAHRTTLTTGQVMMEQGRLKGFDISQGEVSIEGLGMDSSQQNYTEIIARSVAINGKLHAQDLKVTTGRNIVDAAHKNIEKKSADDSKLPKFTLDVAALGGMYANKITLIGTESGVGVRNAGHIGASAGEVHLTINGQIENRGTIAARGNTTITASKIQSNNGSILAAGIDDKGKATLPGSLTLTAKQQIQANGQNLATNTLEVQSKKIDLSGSQTSANNIQLTASQKEISTANATITADRFTAKTPDQFNNNGGKLVAREINLTTPDLSNNQGEINQTGKGDLVLNTQKLSNRGGTLFNEGKQLTITTTELDNQRGKIANNGHNLNLTIHEANNTLGTIQLSGEGKLSLNTQQWIGDGGKLLSNGELDIQAHNLQLNEKAVTTANKITIKADTLSHQSGLMQQKGKDKMSLTANTLNNHNGEIEGNGNLTINATTVDNRKGKIAAAEKGSLKLTVNDTLNNQNGSLEAGQDIQLTSRQLDNSQGKIAATGGNAELITEQNIKNADGRIEAKTELTTKSQALNNHQGQLLAQQIDIQTKGHKFINTAGQVIAREKLTLNSGELDNTFGLLQSGNDMIVNTHGQKLTNANSDKEKGILSQGNLELSTGDINNTAGIISAKGKTTLNAGNVNNTDGQFLSQQMAELTTQALDNTRGQIQSESSLLLDTQNQALININSGKTGGIIAKDSLQISSGKLNNDAGFIRGHGINIDTHQQVLSNQSGTIASKKNLQLDSGELNSTGGKIKSDGDMTLDTHGKKLTTAKSSDTGGVASEGTLTLTTGEIDNHDGSIIGTRTTTITGGELHNQRGKLASKTGSLTLTVNKTDNSGGLMQSAGDLTLDTQGGLLTNTNSGKNRGITSTGNMKLITQGVNNDAGLIHAGKNLILDGQQGTITNRNSQPDQGILSSEDLTLTADAIDNHQGTVAANQQLKVTSGTVDNTGGLLKSGSTLSLNTQGKRLINTQSGDKQGIRSGHDLTLEAGEIDNTAGMIESQGETTLTSQNLNNTDGKILSQKKAGLTTQAINNQRGLIQSAASLDLDTQQHELVNTDSGENGGIIAKDALELTTGKLINDRGSIRGDQTHINTHLQALNNLAGTIASNKNLQLDSGELDSTGGRIESAGDMTLDTHGAKLTNAQSGKNGGVISKSTLTLTTGEIDNHDGVIIGKGTTTVTGGELNNRGGTLASETGALTLTVGKTDNSGGLLQSADDLTLNTQGGLLTNINSGKSGGIISTGNMNLTAQGINNKAGFIHAGKNLSLNEQKGTITNSNSQPGQGISSLGTLTMTAGTIDNQQGRIIADKQLTVTSTGTVDNTSGKMVSQHQQLTMNTGELNNTGGLLRSKTTLSLNTHGQKLINTQSGDKHGILSGGDLTLEAGEIDNTAGAINSQGETTLTSQNLNNTDGKILSQGKADLTTQAVNNQRGLIQSAASLDLDTQQHELVNTDSGENGGIVAQNALELTTGKLLNDRGSIRGDQTHINTHQQALNNLSGTIASKKNLQLDSGELDNTGGRIESAGDMTLDTHGEKLTTAKSGDTGGVISKGTLTLTTGEIDNHDGVIIGKGTTTVTGGELNNRGGTLASETGALTLTVGKTDNSGGLLQSADDLTLNTQGGLLTNINSGKTGGIVSASNASLTAQGINNKAGFIHADKNLILDGLQGKITNSNSQPEQGISSLGTLTMTAGTIDNQQGRVIADKQLTVTSTGIVDNTSGKMVSQHQQLTLNTGELNNAGGLLRSKTTLSLNTHGQKLINTQSGDKHGILSGGNLTLEAGEIDNTAGVIESQGGTTLTSQNLNNTKGKILSLEKADLTTAVVNNQRGLIQSATDLKLDTQQHKLTNTDSGKSGGVIAKNTLKLTTGNLINDHGFIRGDETHIDTQKQALNNLDGIIFSKKNLQLDSGELNSTGGTIESDSDITLDTHGEKLTTAQSGKNGGVISKGTLTLTTGEIDNRDGAIIGTGTTTVTGGELKNQGGTLVSETGALTLTVNETNNSNGLLQSAGDLTLDTQGGLLTNINSGKNGGILSKGNVNLTAQGINNDAGLIHAGKNLILYGLQGKITNRNSQPKQGILSLGTLTMTADAIDNHQGIVSVNQQLKVTSSGIVKNTGGKIVSEHQQLTLNTGEMDNTGGLLQSGTTLSLDTHGQKLTNAQSRDKLGIRSGSNLTLQTGEIDNTAGVIGSQDEIKLTSQDLNNTDGKILSKGKASLTTKAVNNQRGLVQSAASLELDTQQQELTNTDSGEINGIMARDAMKLTTGKLTNDRGFIRGDETHIDTQKQSLHNKAGTIVSKKNLQLDSGELDSTGGRIDSAGNMTLNTHGEKLTTAQSGDNGGVISKGTMTLTTGEIDNHDGVIIGTGKTTITGGELKNQRGTLASKTDALELSVNETDNSGGLLHSAGKLTLNTNGHTLTNKNSRDQGGIRSQDDMLITSGDLHNQAGIIASHKIATLNTAAVNNTQGTLTGTQQIELTTQAFNNLKGTVRTDGKLSLNTQGQRLDNNGDKDKSGKFSAQGDLKLDIGELNNNTGFIAADGKTDITGTTLTNDNGRIAGNGGLAIHSQTLTNRGGTLQSAKTINIDTNRQLLDNQHGRIIGDGNTTVTSGKLDNQHGHIQGEKLVIDTGRADTDNQDGKLLSTDTMDLNTLLLDNRHGQVQAVGDATINAQQQTNNTGGFIHGSQQLALNTAKLINRETNRSNQGTEAQNLIIEAQQVDNTQGALRGADSLQAIVSQTLDNTQGMISGGKRLTIEDEDQELTINNQKGTLIASEKTSIKVDTLSGDGQILSQGDMEIKLKQDFHNTGNTAANGNLSLETAGNIINDSTIKAGQAYLVAKNLTNTQAAEISAGKTRIHIRDTLTNTGLIDGELTHLTTKILDNMGTGRIYGDRIALQTGTLNNTAQGDKAAVIAARDRMDIATGTLNNLNHAQIYSVRDMLIGGQLDENLTATSQAGRLINHAATIEAGGNLGIDAALIRNTNNRLVTHVVETEKSQRHEAVLSGHTTRYDWSQVDTSYRNKYGIRDAIMPDGSRDNKFYEYQYTHTVTETQIKESDPGKILAGGNITLNSTMLTNNDSQIVAGAILGGNIDELHNNSTKGERITADEGNQIRWYPKKKKRQLRRSKRSQGKSWSDYRPTPIKETIDLKALAWQANTRPDTAGITISDRQTGSVQNSPAGINPASRMAGAGDVSLTNATINAITLSIPTQTNDRSLQANDRGTTVAIPTEAIKLPNRDIPVDRPLVSPTGQHTEQALSSGTLTLPSRDALTEHPMLSPTSQQTEQVLPSGTVVLPNRDALAEHPTLSPTGQTERVLPPNTITLPDSDPLDERPLMLPTGQQFELALPPTTVKGQTAEPLIRIIAPETRLPDNSLYIVQPGSDSHYLVETDPKFTQYKKWLGTDYMQQQLTNDPALTHKRLGDGFYEQRLVRDQITQLTGHRYLAGHNNDEAQFKALMEAGVAFGKQQQLTPGIALSPSQMALLTSDIIWLTNRTVTLPDGTTQTVTVPQVYARVNKGDLTGDGALLSGHNVTLNSRGDITNSGTITGREVTQLTAKNLTNSGFIQGGKVNLTTQQDITNLGGSIQGQDRVSVLAGRDITSASALRGEGVDRWLDRPAGIYVQNDQGTLSLKAINNVRLTASEVNNAGKDSQTEITAGLDLTLDTLRTRRTENGDWGNDNYRHLTQERDTGSQINTAGNLALRAGNNLKATAANVNAGQQLTAQAGNNLTLDAGTASSDLVEHSKQTSKGLLSKSSVETHDEVHERRAVSTTLSGDSVTVQAGNDLNIIGSNVAGTQDVNLAAGNQLTVTTADEARHETHLRKEKKSGLMGTGGIGFTVGKASQKSTTNIDSNLSKGSTVGSSQGSVTFNAGEQLNIHGSDVVAGRDMQLAGQNVTITSAENSHTAISKTEQKQSGLTVALSGTAGSAVNTAVQTVKAASNESDSRLKALQGTKAALSGVQAVQAARLADAKGGDNKTNNNLVGINLSYGSQSSRSEQKQHQTTQQGSSLTTGDNLNITATGKDTSTPDGDIRIQGSRLQAGKDLQLNANRDIQLTSSQNTEQTTGSNSSRSGSLGIGFTAGPGGTGLNISASVNHGKGRESGDGVSHNETTVSAGHTVTLNAGRDATLKGAQVSGEQITADVKRNLTLTSEQDSNRYDMKQQNVSAGTSVTVGPQTDGTVSFSIGRDKIHSNFDSVQEQTGLFAGKGGYEVNVGEHTQLDGAVIASTADKAKNTLETGTLGFGDIQNKADFKTEHQSAGFSTGGPVGSSLLSNLASNTLGGANKEGHAQSTTHAAVSDGTIAIRDKDKQQQDITTLSRDTDNAGNALSPIFDKEKEQKRLRQAQLIREISAQV
uniref:hemagglutinin repeat-containing protein n=1 Tax=Photorhabdus sp. RM322S TaxID=3342825 RepID=UPI0036DC8421